MEPYIINEDHRTVRVYSSRESDPSLKIHQQVVETLPSSLLPSVHRCNFLCKYLEPHHDWLDLPQSYTPLAHFCQIEFAPSREVGSQSA